MTPSTVEAQPWQILSGLIVSGFLLALPGGLLPLWGYHMHSDMARAGNYFLLLGAGVAAGGFLARRLAHRISLGRLLAGGCFMSAAALLLLSVAAPPAQTWFQFIAMAAAGSAAGIVNTAVLEGMATGYESNPAAITLMGGIFFGAGNFLAALLMSESFGEEGATQLLAITALAPAAAGIAFSRLYIARYAVSEVSLEEALRDLRSSLAILFALLLFFQFANEWAIAGWLPVFLIDRTGMSPSAAVRLLAVYWLALMLGRLAAAKLLKVVRHGRMLTASAFCAFFGCAALISSTSIFGIVAGILLAGAGFSGIYPLAAERIASRFSYYHPGYFNGIFTFALMGGILAPFAVGHLAAEWGLRVVPLTVMAGSFAVFGLVMVIWLGRKVSGL